MTLVSSANNLGFDIEFILRGKSIIRIRTIQALELILGKLRVSMYPSQKKNCELHGDFTPIFCVVLVK
jgi:hypothetical protein